jgi:hypothetical protein
VVVWYVDEEEFIHAYYFHFENTDEMFEIGGLYWRVSCKISELRVLIVVRGGFGGSFWPENNIESIMCI